MLTLKAWALACRVLGIPVPSERWVETCAFLFVQRFAKQLHMGTENNYPAFEDTADRLNVTLAIVDDHHLWQEKIGEMLSELGFTITMTAPDGREFLEMLEDQAAPELCLLDISMPVMDGYETARQLKARYPNITILAFSMENDDTTVARIMECGAHGFLPKGRVPFEIRNALLLLLLNKNATT